MVLAASTPKHAHREHRNLPGPDIDDAGGKQTGDQILASGGQALFLHHDVTQEQQWIGVVAGTQERFRGVDVLFNNASIYIIAPLTEITVETWNHLMAINVTGMFLGMKHTVPAMLARGGGSIINASSVAGLRGMAGHTLYGASKGAVRLMSKDVAAEYASAHIGENSIHPTYTKTAMADYGAKAAGMTLQELGTKTVPMGRLAEVEGVARVVVFLASDDAAYLTGGEYVIDGGQMSSLTL